MVSLVYFDMMAFVGLHGGALRPVLPAVAAALIGEVAPYWRESWRGCLKPATLFGRHWGGGLGVPGWS
jgi:hypothetical protein